MGKSHSFPQVAGVKLLFLDHVSESHKHVQSHKHLFVYRDSTMSLGSYYDVVLKCYQTFEA